MKRTSWLCWLLVLAALCCAAEGQYKFRRPQLPPPPHPGPPPQIFKKSWAPGPRIPPLGNSIHMPGNFPPKRPLFKPPNYRFRRPAGPAAPPPPPASPLFNVLPSGFKSPLPGLGLLGGYGPLPQRGPPAPKDLQPLAKLPQQYSPEYRPAEASLMSLGPPGNRGLDDDKGPIHTIPAPNLGPASKSYQLQQQQQQQQAFGQEAKPEEQPRRPYSVSQVDYASIFGQESNVTPQRVMPSNPTPVNGAQHQYEVTESNEVNSAAPAYFAPDFDSTPYASSNVPEQQANDVYPSHPSSSRLGQQQQQQQEQQEQSDAAAGSGGVSMQSSLHVAAQPGEPAASPQPMMSAAKLYEVLGGFPHRLTEHYALNQAPQVQQHLLQQQLSQMMIQQQQQQQNEQGLKPAFSQPALHSFNYDEQANKKNQQQQQRQNIFMDQNYASGKVTADYSLAPEPSEIAQDINIGDGNEQQENNIEFESPVGQVKPTTYFTKIGGDDSSLASQFYTTLPNREAAEKLAALAAAGNVNSQLIGHFRRQQQQQQQDQPMPANHKDERQRPQRRQKPRDEQTRRDEDRERQKQQNKEEDKRPLRIFVPERSAEKEREPAPEDYEYENDEAAGSREHEPAPEDTDFGSRIVSKNSK